MVMTLKFNKDNKLEFEVSELFETLPEETKVELIESISTDDSVIKFVIDQILDGRTSNQGYYGYKGLVNANASRMFTHGIEYGRRRIAKEYNEVAKKTIEELEVALTAAQKEIYDLNVKEQNARHRSMGL